MRGTRCALIIYWRHRLYCMSITRRSERFSAGIQIRCRYSVRLKSTASVARWLSVVVRVVQSTSADSSDSFNMSAL